MANVLLVLDGFVKCFMKNGTGVNSDLADATYTRDNTLFTGSNFLACVQMTYLQHLWLDKFFPVAGELLDEGVLDAGTNIYANEEPIDNVQIILDTTNYQGDLTYGGSKYANYGSLTFTDNNNFQQAVQWINYPRSILYPAKQVVLGWELFLKQGITGTWKVYKQSSVPPVDWNTNGVPHVCDPYNNRII